MTDDRDITSNASEFPGVGSPTGSNTTCDSHEGSSESYELDMCFDQPTKRQRKSASRRPIKRFAHDPAVVSTQTSFDISLAFSLDIVKEDGEDKLHKNTDARYNKAQWQDDMCLSNIPPLILVVGERACECLGLRCGLGVGPAGP